MLTVTRRRAGRLRRFRLDRRQRRTGPWARRATWSISTCPRRSPRPGLAMRVSIGCSKGIPKSNSFNSWTAIANCRRAGWRPRWPPPRSSRERRPCSAGCGNGGRKHRSTTGCATIEWDAAPVGDAKACGGNRADANGRGSRRSAGSTRPCWRPKTTSLCLRLRRAGWTIVRIAADMG